MLGDNIKELRNKKGIYQQDLADSLSVSKSTVAMWETNKREPDLTMLRKIAIFFDVSIDNLLGFSEEKVKETINNDIKTDESLIILNRNAKKLTPENRKKLLDMAKIMFKEEFDDHKP